MRPEREFGNKPIKSEFEIEITAEMIEAAREVICTKSLYFENAGRDFFEETAREAIIAAIEVRKYLA